MASEDSDLTPSPETTPKVSRTPVVLDDRRRWPILVWTLAALTWFLGSAVFFTLYLAEGLAMLNAGDITDKARSAAAWYLIWLLVFALLVPLATAVTAILARRKAAAVAFTAILALSALFLFSLAPPSSMLSAISTTLG